MDRATAVARYPFMEGRLVGAPDYVPPAEPDDSEEGKERRLKYLDQAVNLGGISEREYQTERDELLGVEPPPPQWPSREPPPRRFSDWVTGRLVFGLIVLVFLVFGAVQVLSSISKSGPATVGGSLGATGCPSQMTVGDQMTMRARYTAPHAAKFTIVSINGADNFTRDSLADETTDAQPSQIGGEFELPGPSAGQTKTIVGTFTAKAAGNSTISLIVWGSDDSVSSPPDSAQSVSCNVAVNP